MQLDCNSCTREAARILEVLLKEEIERPDGDIRVRQLRKVLRSRRGRVLGRIRSPAQRTQQRRPSKGVMPSRPDELASERMVLPAMPGAIVDHWLNEVLERNLDLAPIACQDRQSSRQAPACALAFEADSPIDSDALRILMGPPERGIQASRACG